MPLDFTAFGTQSTIDALAAEYQRLAAQLATLPLVNVSDQGRSISADRAAIMAAMEKLREQAALIAGPAFVVSAVRP
jgi:hypothetical protein